MEPEVVVGLCIEVQTMSQTPSPTSPSWQRRRVEAPKEHSGTVPMGSDSKRETFGTHTSNRPRYYMWR